MTTRHAPSSFVTALALLLALGASACGSSGAPATEEPTTGGESESAPITVTTWTMACTAPIEALSQVPEASRFLQLLEPAQLVQALTEMQGGTVFVPTNAALEALPAAIEQDPAALRNFLAGHFTMGTVSTALLLEAGSVELFDQQRTSLPVVTSRGATTVGPAHVVRPDLRCEGVTIHLVDAVLPLGRFDPTESPNPFQVNLWRLPAE